MKLEKDRINIYNGHFNDIFIIYNRLLVYETYKSVGFSKGFIAGNWILTYNELTDTFIIDSKCHKNANKMEKWLILINKNPTQCMNEIDQRITATPHGLTDIHTSQCTSIHQ